MGSISENQTIEKYMCRTIGCLYGKNYKHYGGTCIFMDCPNRSKEWVHTKKIDMRYIADRQHEVDALNAYYNTANVCKSVGEMLKSVGMEEAGDIACKGATAICQMANSFRDMQEELRINGFSSVYHLLSEYESLREKSGYEADKPEEWRAETEKEGGRRIT